MDKNSPLAKELIGLEKKYWQAMQDHNLSAALELTDFPCLVAGPQGARLVHINQFKKMFASHKDSTMHVTFNGEPEVRMLNENSAIIAYKVRSETHSKGKVQTVEAVDTSTWVKRDGEWACAHHTETPLQLH
ncbi:MAG: nuclear transport factor 2 family protein [Bdellovibrionota bacterium]